MRRPLRKAIPQRRRFFVGCEGESERAYVALLHRICEDRGRHVHLDAVPLGGGDPLAIVEAAVRQLEHRRWKSGLYAGHVIFLDADRRDADQERANRAILLANVHGFQMVWQEPCHEALLLRHIEQCETLRPPTSALAELELTRRWPEYFKGMPAVRLAVRLDEASVTRAARVEPELRRFLEWIGLGQDGD